MIKQSTTTQSSSGFPIKLAKPAQRALANAGISNLQQLAKWQEEDLAELHGIGKNAMEQLKNAMIAQKLSFAGKK